MRLSTAQSDRAAGVLLGQACGDAFGVPYEFGRPPVPRQGRRGDGRRRCAVFDVLPEARGHGAMWDAAEFGGAR